MFRVLASSLRLSLSSLLLLYCLSAAAEDRLPSPKAAPILTIGGAVGLTNVGAEAHFDREMLEAMGMVTIATSTPWFDGVVRFDGIPLARILATVDAQGKEVVAIALNDYRTTIPLSDIEEHGAVLAIKRNGEYMPVSEKGPLFIVYPYDKDPQLHSQKFYAQSVWQLKRLIVR